MDLISFSEIDLESTPSIRIDPYLQILFDNIAFFSRHIFPYLGSKKGQVSEVRDMFKVQTNVSKDFMERFPYVCVDALVSIRITDMF